MTVARYVYFMKPVGMVGPIKIGFSHFPQERLRVLGTWSPFPLELITTTPGDIQDETFLHSCFSDCHSHFEWFEATPELLEVVAKIAAGSSIEELRPSLTPNASILSKKRAEGPLRKVPKPDYQSGFIAYSRRASWALKDGAEPVDIAAILNRWSEGAAPTSAELARLDDYLSGSEARAA